jgi:hypothetical protein
MRRVALVSLIWVGCGGGPPARKPPPDLSPVTEQFAPSKVPLGQAMGLSAVLALGADPSRAADLDRLSALHAGFVRRDFLWSQLEPQEGAFDFAGEDAAVDDSNARGLATIGILAYDVAWAAPGGDPYAPPDPDKYSAFVEAVATHFRGRVAAWEIWNEENLGFRFWKPAEDPAAYAELLARAYPAVKRGDPAALVVLGGLNSQGVSSTGEQFLADAYFARPDLGRFCDAIGLHPYAFYPPQTPPEQSNGADLSLGLKLARMRALLAYYGDAAKPIFITEYGYPVYGAVDEAAQARFLERGAIEALAAGADRFAIYTLNDGPNPTAFPPEDAFGLVRNDGTPKPAYGVLAALYGLDPSAVLTADESSGDQRRYRFAGASKRFTVSWITSATSDPTIQIDP